jgi:hypothetical protein
MTTITTPAPRAAGRSRLAGVDAARGLAVLGMVAVHVLPTSRRTGARRWRSSSPGGRSRRAFAVLAGVGVALATRAARPGRQRLRCCCERCSSALWGCSSAGLDVDVAVILAYYAVFFVLLLPFLGWPPRRLLARGRAGRPARAGAELPRAAPLPAEASPTRLVLAAGPGGAPVGPAAGGRLPGRALGGVPAHRAGRRALALDRTSTAVRLVVAGAVALGGAAAASALLLGPLRRLRGARGSSSATPTPR